MRIIVLDIDPATVQVRSRDTEYSPSDSPMPWSEWVPLQEQPDAAELYVALLAAALVSRSSHLVGGATQVCTLVEDIQTGDGKPIRTIEYQVRISD
jgi:hypothetical protein